MVLKYFYRLLGRMLLGGASAAFCAAMLWASVQLAPGGWLTAAAVFVTEPAGVRDILHSSAAKPAAAESALPSITDTCLLYTSDAADE